MSDRLLENGRITNKIQVEQCLKRAEIRSLDIQANSQIVENWVQWSEKMEKRICEIETKNKELMEIISNQRKRITDLTNMSDNWRKKLFTWILMLQNLKMLRVSFW